ncbi:MAG: hypothetical protein ABGW81_06545 [Paracoccaceae bacterium]
MSSVKAKHEERGGTTHANSGGFEGQFTGGVAMQDLRGSLTEKAREVIGQGVYGVLVTDILRQDI